MRVHKKFNETLGFKPYSIIIDMDDEADEHVLKILLNCVRLSPRLGASYAVGDLKARLLHELDAL